MPFYRNCIAGILAVLIVGSAGARQAPVTTAEGGAEFLVFLGGRQVGREQVNVAKSGGNWIITSSGRLTAPSEIVLNRFEARYSSDWQPLELHIDATAGGKPIGLKTSFGLTTAVNEITQNGTTTAKTDQISARTIILPNNFFAAYEALAARLATVTPGTELPIYIAPQMEIKATVKNVQGQTLTTSGGPVETRRFELTLQNPTGPLAATVTIDATQRLARVEIPSAGISIVRSDLATVDTRPAQQRNPTDADTTIPATGFNLAATVTTPTQVAGRLRHPAVVLVAGSGPVERDSLVAGIPIFTQLAGALAAEGYLVVRYDKRGVGQSGGRTETATLDVYADDVVSVVRWLERRRDVDRKRIAVVGHSEGGAVALLAGAKHKNIASLVLVAAPGTTGAELVLEQQRRALESAATPEEERQAKIDMQQRIQTAVMTGVGWEKVPDDLRRRADTPWFRSLLEFDPAKAMARTRQPILVIQGALDRQVPAAHADRLAELARARKKAGAVEVVQLPGVNHLLVRATTGEVGEYATLKEKVIVPDVATKISDWLRK